MIGAKHKQWAEDEAEARAADWVQYTHRTHRRRVASGVRAPARLRAPVRAAVLRSRHRSHAPTSCWSDYRTARGAASYISEQREALLVCSADEAGTPRASCGVLPACGLRCARTSENRPAPGGGGGARSRELPPLVTGSAGPAYLGRAIATCEKRSMIAAMAVAACCGQTRTRTGAPHLGNRHAHGGGQMTRCPGTHGPMTFSTLYGCGADSGMLVSDIRRHMQSGSLAAWQPGTDRATERRAACCGAHCGMLGTTVPIRGADRCTPRPVPHHSTATRTLRTTPLKGAGCASGRDRIGAQLSEPACLVPSFWELILGRPRRTLAQPRPPKRFERVMM